MPDYIEIPSESSDIAEIKDSNVPRKEVSDSIRTLIDVPISSDDDSFIAKDSLKSSPRNSDPIVSSPFKSLQLAKSLLEVVHEVPEPAPKSRKVDKAAEKAIKEANKKKTKEDVLREMIIEIAYCLKDIQTPFFHETFANVEHRNTYLEIPTVKWRRKVEAIYNADTDAFDPCSPREVTQDVVLLVYDAARFIENVQDGGFEEDMKELLSHVIVVVIGFKEYTRKLAAAEDRRYREALRLKMENGKARKTEESQVTAAEATRLVHETEVKHRVTVFHVKNNSELVEWLFAFTASIGHSIYDKSKRLDLNVGSVKLGTDTKSTFFEMMKKFNLMTPQRIETLYEFFKSPGALYDRLIKEDTLGTVNKKNIVPPTVGAAMKRVFTATDPESVVND